MKAAVVGAGIVGRLMALRLCLSGFKVSFFERLKVEEHVACSDAAAGLLAPVGEGVAALDPVLYTFGLRSMALWPDLLAELSAPVDLRSRGSLAAASSPGIPCLKELHSRVTKLLPGAHCEWLQARDLAALEPDLSHTDLTAGLYFSEEGCIHSQSLMAALGETLAARGVDLNFNTNVVSLRPGAVATATDTYQVDLVIDARGLGARTDLPLLRGVRGEIIEVHAGEVNIVRPLRFLHERYPVYIVPRLGQKYMIGATCLESESTEPVTVKATLELLSAAYSLHPGFRFATITSLRASCRPAFPNNLPAIECQPGLLRLNGLYRHGYLLAPLITRLALKKALGEPTARDEAFFFREGTTWTSR